MKRHAHRVTIAAAVLGATVIGVLVVLNWATVRDHIEAWHLQLTRKTETIEPNSALNGLSEDRNRLTLAHELMFSRSSRDFPLNYLDALASSTGCPVIFVQEINAGFRNGGLVPLLENLVDVVAQAKQKLQRNGYRILEQRFPRRAYVVIRESQARQEQELDQLEKRG